MNCFECGTTENLHGHHVVPRSLGGTKTIPLCPKCHGLVHSLDYSTHHLTAKVQREKMARGEYIGGRPPFGFRNVDGVLVPVPHEQDAARQARELRSEGRTLRAVAAELEARGILSRTGRTFASEDIRRMVAASEANP
jgi:hypothetical protein